MVLPLVIGVLLLVYNTTLIIRGQTLEEQSARDLAASDLQVLRDVLTVSVEFFGSLDEALPTQRQLVIALRDPEAAGVPAFIADRLLTPDERLVRARRIASIQDDDAPLIRGVVETAQAIGQVRRVFRQIFG